MIFALAKIPWVAVATAGGVLAYLLIMSLYWIRKRRRSG